MSDPTRSGPGRGGRSTIPQADTGKGTSDRSWSDCYPTVRERDVLAAITDAPIRTLVRSFDEGAFRNDHGPNGFVCPRCGAWRAEVTTPALWWCAVCDRPGTRYELAHLVACDPFASVRLAQLVGVLR